MIGLQPTNPKSEFGNSAFDLSLRNISSETISTPLTLVVENIRSECGRVRVANAGNGKTSAGATWDYSTLVGSGNVLHSGELSASRKLKFFNPAHELFTVTFRVVGVLATEGCDCGPTRCTEHVSQSNQSNAVGRGAIGPLTNALISVTYDPLLDHVTWKVMRQ